MPKQFKNMKKILNNKGYTLIEIITVVFIISIMITIVMPNFTLLIKNSKAKQDYNIAKNIAIASDSIMNDILMGKHIVIFNKHNVDYDENTEVGYDFSNDYTVSNGSFNIGDNIKTPIKLILYKGKYINDTLGEDFFKNTEIIYDPYNLVIKSVSYKGIIYTK